MRYANFWTRFAASLIDGIILYILGAIAGFMIGFVYGLTTGTSEGAALLGGIAGLLVGWLYYALMESSPQQATLGKQAMGIVVTDENGDRISFGKATGRHFGKFISSIILLIGYIMAAFTEKRQALHDMMAGTLVVKK
ncbi:RDD family protein [Oculatella sp. LEGE 06141]|uniref:RDD family protein n=1 Tax=Oculatella sp. LEGE 06141 TaxID=1828648 RepID=UPI001882C881|nr:RDD family protein [Oculatella sp. LEGE 06141]MBE9178168.1 RDD family protein [Oculatella sp. LEGE 06141]